MGLDDAVARARRAGARPDWEIQADLRARIARCDEIILDTERCIAALFGDLLGRLAVAGNPGSESIRFWVVREKWLKPSQELPPRYRRRDEARQGWWIPHAPGFKGRPVALLTSGEALFAERLSSDGTWCTSRLRSLQELAQSSAQDAALKGDSEGGWRNVRGVGAVGVVSDNARSLITGWEDRAATLLISTGAA